MLREVTPPRRFEVIDVEERVLRSFSDEEVAEDWLLREGYEDVTGSLNYPDEEHVFPDIGGFKRPRPR